MTLKQWLIHVYALLGAWALFVSVVAYSPTAFVITVCYLLPYIAYRYRNDQLATVPFTTQVKKNG